MEHEWHALLRQLVACCLVVQMNLEVVDTSTFGHLEQAQQPGATLSSCQHQRQTSGALHGP